MVFLSDGRGSIERWRIGVSHAAPGATGNSPRCPFHIRGSFLFLGFTPGGPDAIEGIAIALIMGYILLRDEIDRYLTEIQEWMMFALFGIACVTGVLAMGGDLSDEPLFGYVVCLAASRFFIYRAEAAS